ncbi:MAG: SsrA-binding protein SmpB [Planctomycetes bacterium]|nr:SsrA-binding protein SmpB [Planctomycetota bacterium]
MAKHPESKPDYSLSRVVCRNRKARHDYELLEQLECGIALRGSEVKSIRNNKIAIEDAYVRVENGEIWLIGADIAEYPQATYLNHDPKRQRKLLMHRREMAKFARAADQKGLTLVPLDIHLTRGFVKVQVAIARGQKEYDKRDKIRKQVDQQEMRQAIRRSGR